MLHLNTVCLLNSALQAKHSFRKIQISGRHRTSPDSYLISYQILCRILCRMLCRILSNTFNWISRMLSALGAPSLFMWDSNEMGMRGSLNELGFVLFGVWLDHGRCSPDRSRTMRRSVRMRLCLWNGRDSADRTELIEPIRTASSTMRRASHCNFLQLLVTCSSDYRKEFLPRMFVRWPNRLPSKKTVRRAAK